MEGQAKCSDLTAFSFFFPLLMKSSGSMSKLLFIERFRNTENNFLQHK